MFKKKRIENYRYMIAAGPGIVAVCAEERGG
jgi:hypothetical protein